MRRGTPRKLLSFTFFLAGAILLFLGGREFLGSRIGQFLAERKFDEKPAPPRPKAAPERFSAKPGETIAKLSFPRLGKELFVVEGDSEEQLRAGPGRLSDSAPPGTNGNCVIAGHRDTHFRILKDLKKGDDILIETKRGQFLYRVSSTQIVSPDNTDPIKPTKHAELNLVTCYPFFYVGNAPKRFVVEARLAAAIGT